MNEQASGLRGAIALPRLPVPFCVVTGGKGGVGKSTVAANLALSLARTGARILLIDLDFGLGDLELLMRVETERSVEDFFRHEAGLEACISRRADGLHVLTAGTGSLEMGRADDRRRALFLRELARVATDYDMVVGDCAAGIGPDVLAFAGIADHVLAVTQPDPTAITDAYGLIKALDAWSTETGVEVPTPEIVVNSVTGPNEAEDVCAKLRQVSERFLARSPVLAGWIPRSAAVARSVRSRQPFVVAQPKSLPSNCLRRLANRVSRRARGPEAAVLR